MGKYKNNRCVRNRRNNRDSRYLRYSTKFSKYSDDELNKNKLSNCKFSTRAERQSAWELYKAVFKCDKKYYQDGSISRANFTCKEDQRFLKTKEYQLRKQDIIGLMNRVLLDEHVLEFGMKIYPVTAIADQIKKCIIYLDFTSSTPCRYIEDEKLRVENRNTRCIRNIVNVEPYETNSLLITTQDTIKKRPYLIGDYERLLGDLADKDLPDCEFRVCYKVPIDTVMSLYVVNCERNIYHVDQN